MPVLPFFTFNWTSIFRRLLRLARGLRVDFLQNVLGTTGILLLCWTFQLFSARQRFLQGDWPSDGKLQRFHAGKWSDMRTDPARGQGRQEFYVPGTVFPLQDVKFHHNSKMQRVESTDFGTTLEVSVGT